MATLGRRFDAELAPELQKIQAAQPAPGSWLVARPGNRAVRATSFECGDKVHAPPDAFGSVGCLLHLEVKNLAATAENVPAYDDGVDSLHLAVIDGLGRRHSMYFLGRMEGGAFHATDWHQRIHELAPDAVVELLYRLPVEEPFRESYFNGASPPFAKNLALYEPVLIEVRGPRQQGEKVERYLRVK
jgi:hypothetical protein